MIEIVDNFLKKYNLTTPDNTFIVGFSGGCDSLCLLDILVSLSQNYGFKVIALHLNHNWRGEESLQEEKNCKAYCEKMGVGCIIETLEKSENKTESIARAARYAFFLKHAKQYAKCSIFTAHTRTDNAETLIYRIIKGTGIKGLQGILPERLLDEIPLYRPLLSFSRRNIEDYCNSKGLVPNVDSSNFDVNYKRNFIRHKIMPLFEEINFNAEKSINSLAKMAISQNNIVEEYINLIMKDIYIDSKLATDKFVMLSDDVKLHIIHKACFKYNLEYDSNKIEQILAFIIDNSNSNAGSRYSLTNNLWLFVNSKYIYLIDKLHGDENKNEILINTEGKWKFSEHKSLLIEKFSVEGDFTFPKETDDYAYVSFDSVGLRDLTLRTRRDGDFITPFGMVGKMKLKKYLNSKGVSQHEKDDLILLCKDQEVFWVAGVGLSNKLKVVNEPTHVLRLVNR